MAAERKFRPEEIEAGRRVLGKIRARMAEPGYERRFEEWRRKRGAAGEAA